MIYVVASQQDLHLKQLFKIIELLGHKEIAAKCQRYQLRACLGHEHPKRHRQVLG